jgi:crossover junction endodeoxyribonuclease RuvC
MSVVVGIDPSIRSTGVCVLGAEADVELSQISFPELRGVARLVQVVDRLQEILKENLGEHPDSCLVVIEGYATRGGENNSLVELGGCIRYHLHRAALPFVVVPPSSLKKFVTGKGNADKVTVCQYIERRYGRQFLRPWPGKDHPKRPKTMPATWGANPAHYRNDEADAFALAHLGYALLHDRLPASSQLTAHEREVLAGLRLDPTGDLLAEDALRKLPE